MRNQGLETGQEEKDQERDQDPAEPYGWSEYHWITGRCQRRAGSFLTNDENRHNNN